MALRDVKGVTHNVELWDDYHTPLQLHQASVQLIVFCFTALKRTVLVQSIFCHQLRFLCTVNSGLSGHRHLCRWYNNSVLCSQLVSADTKCPKMYYCRFKLVQHFCFIWFYCFSADLQINICDNLISGNKTSTLVYQSGSRWRRLDVRCPQNGKPYSIIWVPC